MPHRLGSVRSAALACCLIGLCWGGESRDALLAEFDRRIKGPDPASRREAVAWAEAKGIADTYPVLAPVVMQDADRGVRLFAAKVFARATGRLGERGFGYITKAIGSMRGDVDLYLDALDHLVAHHGRGSLKDDLTNYLADYLAALPYPEVPPGGSATVTVPGLGRKGRDVVTETTIDAAEAKRWRERYARVLAHLNAVGGLAIKPSAKAPEEVKRWRQDNGGKALMAAQERALAKARGQQGISSPDQAAVLFAGCLGGAGTEWLAGGGFQADGSVVVAGTALGPVLEIAGMPATALGADLRAAVAPEPVHRLANGKPALDGEGKAIVERFTWEHPQGTAFVARLSADRRTLLALVRFPWGSGAVTSAAVARDGGIYIAGPARDGIAAVSADAKDLPAWQPYAPTHPAIKALTAKRDPASRAYVARLTPDGRRVQWIRTVQGPFSAPKVRVGDDGRVVFLSADVRVLAADGSQVSQRTPPIALSGDGDARADGTAVRCGESHWPTGHEPYRDPWIQVYPADGGRPLKLYHADGPFVGGATGLVSDSAFRSVRFDRQGDLLLTGWSDGGNSVLYREPLDILAVSPAMKGIPGMSAAGTRGASSFAWIVRISTTTWRVTGGSMLNARLASGPPNGMALDAIEEAADGSLLLTGSSAWGCPQTTNAISTGDPAGPAIFVVNRDVTGIRFGSAMPACGRSLVGDADSGDGRVWGMASARVGGRTLAMFTCGAAPSERLYGRECTPPLRDALQRTHGGSLLDGHLVILDLGAAP